MDVDVDVDVDVDGADIILDQLSLEELWDRESKAPPGTINQGPLNKGTG